MATEPARLGPGYRYGAVLLLIAATFVAQFFALHGATGRIVNITLQGCTLLAAFYASEVGRRAMRVALVAVLLALAAALSSAFVDGDGVRLSALAVQLLLVVAAPVAIARALLAHPVIDRRTVLGAVCIYLLLGLAFSFAYGAIGVLSDAPFFVQQETADSSDYVYFSYVTQATVGYGDLTAREDLGRSLAVLEALTGQLYLVTVVALLVGRFGSRRHGGPEESVVDDGR